MLDDDKEREEEVTYRKVDARQGRTEGEPPEEAPAEEPTAPDAEPEAAPEGMGQIDVYGVLRFAASLLMQTAWMDLGIQASPGAETRTNLPHAKVAIDALSDIVARLQPDLDPAEKHEMEGVLANLRINYVQRS
jgi:hypothetical protein